MRRGARRAVAAKSVDLGIEYTTFATTVQFVGRRYGGRSDRSDEHQQFRIPTKGGYVAHPFVPRLPGRSRPKQAVEVELLLHAALYI